MNDLISRQAAIDALGGNVIVTSRESAQAVMDYIRGCADRIRSLPSAQPSIDEWCYSCKEYDQERHCCPRWNKVIRQTLKDAQPDPLVAEIEEEYRRWVNVPYIRKPLAKALYEVWKKHDMEDVERRTDETTI